jgi:hypothetical protein
MTWALDNWPFERSLMCAWLLWHGGWVVAASAVGALGAIWLIGRRAAGLGQWRGERWTS